VRTAAQASTRLRAGNRTSAHADGQSRAFNPRDSRCAANVRARAGAVHRGGSPRQQDAAYPQPVGAEALSSSAAALAALHSAALTYAHIALIPKNGATEPRVAASPTRAGTIITAPTDKNKP